MTRSVHPLIEIHVLHLYYTHAIYVSDTMTLSGNVCQVFGPKAQQRSIYDQAISPIVNDVLEGFNCTVFAYGQTGTGKTYTMEGGMRNKVERFVLDFVNIVDTVPVLFHLGLMEPVFPQGGDLPAEAGVIPRAVRHIFDSLEAQNADYNMKVTFLELYNEEITDLLATEDFSKPLEERQKRPISLMEDGRGSVVVRGLEEETVYSANEIYNLLERGAARRRTADTLLNKRSRYGTFFCVAWCIEKSIRLRHPVSVAAVLILYLA